jgi:hypothetical protein
VGENFGGASLMAIDDKALELFFQKQKKTSTDALLPSALGKNKQTVGSPSNFIESTKISITPEIPQNKPLAKREQSVSKALAEPLAKREQSVSKALDKNDQKKKSVSKALAEPLAEVLAKREQSVSKALANVTLDEIVGKEKELLLLLFNKCKIHGSLETPIITSSELRTSLNITAEHVRNLIFRLIKKGFLNVKDIKNGRAGWRKFILSKDTYQNLILNDSVSKALAKREQSVSKALAEPLAEPLANVPSSSSYIYNKTTTTISEEWKNLNFSFLEEIGFTETQLMQLIEKNCNPEIVQESIKHFYFALQHNEKIKNHHHPLNILMGVLRKGQAWIENNYESEDDRALRLIAEHKKKSHEKRKAIIDDVYKIEFDIWHNSLDQGERTKIRKDSQTPSSGEIALRAHFSKNIWPDIKRNKYKIENYE